MNLDPLIRETEDVLTLRNRAGPGAPPRATYRLQLHAGFGFADARAAVPYLAELGISHCYASPYLKARPGSQHGYDISNHALLNPELGGEEEHAAWADVLRAHGMGQVLDVVPNHMGIVGNENVWWNDVLENGPSSPYAEFFDIDFQPIKPDLRNKVLLPILGAVYGEVLEGGQVKLSYEAGAFTLNYFDHRFPVSPCTYDRILDLRPEELEARLGPEGEEALTEYRSILTAVRHLPRTDVTDPEKVAERQREKEVIKRRLAALTDASPPVARFLAENVALINAEGPTIGPSGPGPRDFDLLDALLDAQPYRLAYWRVASDEINYRRFFDINELAALSMEKPEVFAATHEKIFELLRDGKVHGLRIDHPDGLFNPRQYLERLQERFILDTAREIADTDAEFTGLDWAQTEPAVLEAIQRRRKERGGALARPLYVVVEKILGSGEVLPEDWPVYGTTGYEFLNALGGLFVDRRNARAFDQLYRRWTGRETKYRDLVYQKKFLILQVSLSSELNMLATQLDRLSEKGRWSRDFTLNSLRRALREIIACFGVYRSYITGRDLEDRDRFYVERAVAQAKRRNPAISGALFDFIRDVLLLKPIFDRPRQMVEGEASSGEGEQEPQPQPPAAADMPEFQEQLRFVGKFQQVTSPVMAKGVEDTTFYVYNRLLSLNEVGGEPDHFGTGLGEFHRHNEERLTRSPRALSPTATHDHKRGEDTRARIDILSEMPGAWQKALNRWARHNKRRREVVDEEPVPDRNDEWFFYQTLIGAWPPGMAEPTADFVERIQQYMQKAMHEAKVHTSWINPNPKFDQAIRQFVAKVLDAKNARFLDDFRAFQGSVSHYGMLNSLSQVLLKVALPGVPDIYQGTELWDFSLVDPDNRRPVDYTLRCRLLGELRRQLAEADPWARKQLVRGLAEDWQDGRVKLLVLSEALRCRQEYPELFAAGEYLPAEVRGEFADHVCAFVRRQGEAIALAAVPRWLTGRVRPGELPLGREVWGDGLLSVPACPGRRLGNVYTGETLTVGGEGDGTLTLAEVFGHFPVALLVGEGDSR
jgi:(1->4)-alpha-D-glucan 1-alpha-D-glucosylmutase